MSKKKIFLLLFFIFYVTNSIAKQLTNNVIFSVDNLIITDLDINKEINFLKFINKDQSVNSPEILKKEILEVKPYAIICWGRESRNLVAKTLDLKLLNSITRDTNYPYKYQGDIGDFKLVATPHPSNSTRLNSWLSFYENNLKDRTYTKLTRPEVLANFILDKLK